MSAIEYIQVTFESCGVLFGLFIIVCLHFREMIDKIRTVYIRALLIVNIINLFFDSMAIVFRGNETKLGYYMVRISNLIVFLMVGLMGMIFIMFIRYTIVSSDRYLKDIENDMTEKILFPHKKRRERRKIIDLWSGSLGVYDYVFNLCFLILLIYMIAMTISLFTGCFYYFDAQNIYHRNDKYFWIPQMLGLLVLAILNITTVFNRKRIPKTTTLSIFLYTLCPIVAVLIQMKVYGLSLLNFATMISVCLVYGIVSIQEYKYVEIQAAKIVEQGRELQQLTAKNMISQIGPHFIFNTLATIKYLCKENPAMAQEAVDEFATYLRMNIDSLSTQKMIPFEKEIEHVKNYLSIEKKRFGDDIKVEYCLEDMNFMIPCLALQPLVENAVKYGVTQNEDGGVIKISQKIEGGKVVITVEDNGPGFDFESCRTPDGYYIISKNDGREHIGIANVQKRLEMLCEGELFMEGELGKGTKAKICFEKNKIRDNSMIL